MAQQQGNSGKKQDAADCEINKSLDELVSQDMNLSRQPKSGNYFNKFNGSNHNRDGSGSR